MQLIICNTRQALVRSEGKNISQDALQGQGAREDASSNKKLEIALSTVVMCVWEASPAAHLMDTDAVTEG